MYYSGGLDLDITVHINKDQYNKLLEFKKESQITYSAKIKNYGGYVGNIGVEIVLDDGEIVS